MIEEVVRAQFGPSLRAFGGLRRRRNELEYPLYPSEEASTAEGAETLETATEIIDSAAKLLPNLGSQAFSESKAHWSARNLPTGQPALRRT